jgi:hypothetical protein
MTWSVLDSYFQEGAADGSGYLDHTLGATPQAGDVILAMVGECNNGRFLDLQIDGVSMSYAGTPGAPMFYKVCTGSESVVRVVTAALGTMFLFCVLLRSDDRTITTYYQTSSGADLVGDYTFNGTTITIPAIGTHFVMSLAGVYLSTWASYTPPTGYTELFPLTSAEVLTGTYPDRYSGVLHVKDTAASAAEDPVAVWDCTSNSANTVTVVGHNSFYITEIAQPTNDHWAWSDDQYDVAATYDYPAVYDTPWLTYDGAPSGRDPGAWDVHT